jgi:protein SCO1/2
MTFEFFCRIILLMRYYILLFAMIAVLAGCSRSAKTENASANAKRYPFKGKVTAVDRNAKKATIDHDAIPGFMEGMTMDFPIHADWVWDDLKPGSEIRAELVVDNAAKDPFYLENIGIVASPDPNKPVETNPNFAQIGQPVPDFSLTNQDGKKISLKDFRGKALAITFIYAKCPLPDYCIRMSTNFSDLAKKLSEDAELKDKVRLLSISFDPANDTPQKLRAYGIGYLGNDPNAKFDVWQLAVGSDAEVRKIADFFGLRYEVDETNKAQINHSLRTAVIAPNGKVTKIFPGNEWTVADLKNELEKALNSQ